MEDSDFGEEDYGEDFGEDFEMDTEEQMFRSEINIWERMGAVVVDPWILRMTEDLPGIFRKYSLGENTLKLLRSSRVLCNKGFNPRFTFDTEEVVKSFNPVAITLGHYVRSPKGGISKDKLKTISQLLKTTISCRKDKDCKGIHSNCKKNKCVYPEVDLASVVRYGRLWDRIYKNKPQAVEAKTVEVSDSGEDTEEEIEEDEGEGFL